MEIGDGFTPIVAIFYAVFHPVEGTKIMSQVPEHCFTGTESSLFDFNTIKNYVIPKPQLCNRLISLKIDKYKVIGFPVNIQNDKYYRNTFNFNFCFVFPYNSDTVTYDLTIKRMGRMFKVLEEQNFLLSKLHPKLFFKKENLNQISMIHEIPGFRNFKRVNLSSIDSLINQVYQDLNNYSECCIPLDSANSIDIKLFPILPSPLNIKAFQVPILLVNLSSLVDVNWDPTMLKILPYINGINSIKKISELSNSDYFLTKQCIQHLMHYKCIQIIDIFQFSNIYAPTNNIANFLKIPGLSERCQSYIVNHENQVESRRAKASGSMSVSPVHLKESNQTIRVPTKTTLFYLYRSLNQGQTVKAWYMHHEKDLRFVDVRRFINFGVLNGLIYRVHCYPTVNMITKSIENNNDDVRKLLDDLRAKLKPEDSAKDPPVNGNSKYLKTIVNESNLLANRRKISFNYNTRDFGDTLGGTDGNASVFSADEDTPTADHSALQEDDINEVFSLVKMLKGFQTMDSICTELHKSRSEIESLLYKLGSNGLINS